MNHSFRKLASLGLIVSLAVMPAALDAQTRRGAQVLVTLKSGEMIEGELLAVKPDSLLLLNSARTGESIGLPEIYAVKVLRKAKAGIGTLLGVVAGGAAGALYGHRVSGGDEDGLYIFSGLVFFGGIGGILGLFSGIAAGFDAEFVLAGQTEKDISEAMAALRKQARRPAGFSPPLRARQVPAISAPPAGEERASPVAEGRPPRGPRFKITWSAGYLPGDDYTYAPLSSYSFRFLGDVPPAEAGTYSADLYMSRSRPEFSLGCFSLAYELSRHWSAEIEFYRPGNRQDDRFGNLEFTSSLDGLDYGAIFGFDEALSGTAFLAGVAFRLFPPGFLRPHVLEFGVAAGPALMTVKSWKFTGFGEPSLIRRIRPLTLRARAAYDYYFVPALCLGAYAEYRYLRARIPASAYVADVDFYAGSLYLEPQLTRTVELTVPARTADMSGWSAGLRLGFRF